MASEEQEMLLKISQLAGRLPQFCLYVQPPLSDSFYQVKSIGTRTLNLRIIKHNIRRYHRASTLVEVCDRSSRPTIPPLTGTKIILRDGDQAVVDTPQEVTYEEADQLQFIETDRLY